MLQRLFIADAVDTHYAFKLKISFSINIIVLSEQIKRRKYAEEGKCHIKFLFMTSLDDSFTIELQSS